LRFDLFVDHPRWTDGGDSPAAEDIRRLSFAGFGYRAFVASPGAPNGVHGWDHPGRSITVPHWFLVCISAGDAILVWAGDGL